MGSYCCVAKNHIGAVRSRLAIMKLTVAPEFKKGGHPANEVLDPGDCMTMEAAVKALPKAAFEWFHEGRLIAGQTTATLTVEGVAAGSAGEYHCVATNSAGSATSKPAKLTVNIPPFETGPPAISVSSVRVEVGLQGAPEPTCQWFKASKQMEGETTTQVEVQPKPDGSAGGKSEVYTCTASNSAGSITIETFDLGMPTKQLLQVLQPVVPA